MKKLKILSLLLITLLLTACGNKKAIDSDKFKSIMRDNNYYVVNSKEQFSEYDYIVESYIAESDNYQIEFYILQDDMNAKAFYDYNKEIFDAERTSISMYTSVDFTNTNKYTLTLEDSYKVLSRINNTVIYVDVEKEYKNDINSILKKLGY